MAGRAQLAFGLVGMSRSAIGPAAAMMITVSGSRMTTHQVSRAEVICATRCFSRRVGRRPRRRPGQHRDHGAGERAADRQLVDEVRHLVRGHVRGAEAPRAHAVREDERADQAEHAGDGGQPGDEGGTAGDADRDLARAGPVAGLVERGAGARAVPVGLRAAGLVGLQPVPPALRAMTWPRTSVRLRRPSALWRAHCLLLAERPPAPRRGGHPLRSRAISRVACGLSWPPREPASFAARCSPTVTGAYLAGLSALTQLGRHSISASTLPSWK